MDSFQIRVKSMFIFKLWRGEYSLFKTYWLFNILFGTILGSPLSIIGQLPSETIKSTWVYWLIYLILYSLYIIISSVGVWRSASKYTKDSLWKNLAKIYSVISVASIVGIGIFYGTFAINGNKSGELTYSLYGCQDGTNLDPNCNPTIFKAFVKFNVDREKSEVISIASNPNTNYSNFIKLNNCIIVDKLNWQCGAPIKQELDGNGSGFITQDYIYRSINGDVSVSDYVVLSMHKGKLVDRVASKAGIYKRN
jgi:hypothetical protein